MPKSFERRERNRESDGRRRQLKSWRAWYATKAWLERRREQLSKQPLCERCLAKVPSIITPATVAHHKVAHKGDRTLFFEGELASSCAPCHDTVEQGIEARGYEIGCDASGRPVASDHPWNIKQ
ncbi:HNH endonuclease [Tardiphaga sp.]|uniref:HNH endonuclease n=1 Tax=Tardiphaga sp. TaxID=1926292 RepID=UPI002619838A|nr:HNH endonuclease [Tardiphaga sp.]MDB5618220.1 hypothetical protein [Tardiphaga sp.]